VTYYLFFQDDDGNLHQIGAIDGRGWDENAVLDELWQQIHRYICNELHRGQPRIYRSWNQDEFTWIDFGNHSEFFAIRPQLEVFR